MGLIKKELQVAGSLAKRKCEVLFDTGASSCFVRKDVATALSEILKAPQSLTFTLGNKTTITTEYTTVLYIDIKGHSLGHMFLVFSDLPYEVIIGADFLQRWKIKLDPATEEFLIDEKALEIVLI